MSINVLTLESLDKLTEHCRSNPTCSKIIERFEEIEADLELTYAPVDYSFTDDSLPNLIEPTSNNAALESDKDNVLTVFNALSDMSAAHATDERLWSTLAIKHLSSYCRARWPLPTGEKIGGHIISHWLCQSSNRSRTRNNAISRLWWMGFMIAQLENWQQKQVVEVLFNNSDYRAQIIERNSSSSAPIVISTILAITSEAFLKGLPYNRESFREFMKQVNFYAARTNLAALNQPQLIAIFSPVYYQSYENRKSKKKPGKIKQAVTKLLS